MKQNQTKEFIGTCIENPFDWTETLITVVEKAKEITKKTFLKHCIITNKQKTDIKEYPNDYTFWKNQNIYFYCHSCVEYFYE